MFAEIIEYENALDEIVAIELNESQINVLIHIINENPTLSVNKLIEIADNLLDDKQIILDSGTYSIDPILNESQSCNLMELVVPLISKYIPKEIIGYLTETHAKKIVDKILDIEFDENTTQDDLSNRMDEMFSAGDMSIPIQGLRDQAKSVDVVMNGVFAPMLYKSIQFGKNHYEKPIKAHCKNKNTLKHALKDYKMIDEKSPLSKVLPKFIMVLKNLLGKKK